MKNEPVNIDRLLELAATLGNDMSEIEQAFADRKAAKEEEHRRATLPDYNRGYSDAVHGTDYGILSDAEAYDEGQSEGRLYLEDVRVDQIEADYLDGECTLSGQYR